MAYSTGSDLISLAHIEPRVGQGLFYFQPEPLALFQKVRPDSRYREALMHLTQKKSNPVHRLPEKITTWEE